MFQRKDNSHVTSRCCSKWSVTMPLNIYRTTVHKNYNRYRLLTLLSILTCSLKPSLEYNEFMDGGLTRLLETLSNHACDGDQIHIQCPDRTVISIQYAKYGRSVPSSVTCGQGPSRPTESRVGGDTPLTENTNCVAVRSLDVVLDLCESRSSCQVKASPETFTQDPCVGTFKYLEAHYKCRPNVFERQTACEGDEVRISCQEDDRIVVHSATFGHSPHGTAKCPGRHRHHIDCQNKALAQVSSLCQGRPGCVVVASERVFGDPCPSGVVKFLTVSYACVPKNMLKQTHIQSAQTEPVPKKRKSKKKTDTDKVRASDETSTAWSGGDWSSALDDLHPFHSVRVYEQVGVTQVIMGPPTDSPSWKNDFSYLLENTANKEHTDFIHHKEAVPETKLQHRTHKHHPHNSVTLRHAENGGQEAREVVQTVSSEAINLHIQHRNLLPHSSKHGHHKDNPVIDALNKDSVADGDSESSPWTVVTGSSSNRYLEDASLMGSHQNLRNLTSTSVLRGKKTEQASRSEDEFTLEIDDLSINLGNNQLESTSSLLNHNLSVRGFNHTLSVYNQKQVTFNNRHLGFLRDWFSAVHFLQNHQEKVWLYFSLGTCTGIIILLSVILISVCVSLHRNTYARLDLSEPMHRVINNGMLLDPPLIELNHSESMDRIEVVRFSPRDTLTSQRTNSHHRDLVNFYG